MINDEVGIICYKPCDAKTRNNVVTLPPCGTGSDFVA
jgi:hypothetical protein